MESQKEVGIEYSSPSPKKRMLSAAVDFLCVLFTAIALFFAFNSINSISPHYVNAMSAIDADKMASGLFVSNEKGKPELVSDYYANKTDVSNNEKKAIYSKALDAFYDPKSNLIFHDGNGNPSSVGIEHYNNLRKDAKSASGASLFIPVDSPADPLASYQENPLVVVDDLSSYIDFYASAIEEGQTLLVNIASYRDGSDVILWSSIGMAICGYLVSYWIFLLAIPLIFRRGYQTLGMRIAKWGLVYVNGLNPSLGRFLLAFGFRFLFHGILSWVTLFIPIIVSGVMENFSRFKTNLWEYLANVYPVSIETSKIFYTPREYANYVASAQSIDAFLTQQSPEEKEADRRNRFDKGEDQ